MVTHLAMASFLSGERAFGHPGDIFESSLWMMWFVNLQPKCIPMIYTFALASGSAATSCRLCGCKYLVCACRTFAAAPTRAAAARTSVGAYCCYRWPPFLRWACVLLAGLPRSKLPNTLLQQTYGPLTSRTALSAFRPCPCWPSLFTTVCS